MLCICRKYVTGLIVSTYQAILCHMVLFHWWQKYWAHWRIISRHILCPWAGKFHQGPVCLGTSHTCIITSTLGWLPTKAGVNLMKLKILIEKIDLTKSRFLWWSSFTIKPFQHELFLFIIKCVSAQQYSPSSSVIVKPHPSINSKKLLGSWYSITLEWTLVYPQKRTALAYKRILKIMVGWLYQGS